MAELLGTIAFIPFRDDSWSPWIQILEGEYVSVRQSCTDGRLLAQYTRQLRKVWNVEVVFK